MEVINKMIPKLIHYCWFGGNPLPDLAKKCIDSWKLYFPEYEIKEWNEDNFDINCCSYVKEAYSAKKWAFVSDYARFWILYNEGGIYFDTDVEVIKPFDIIIQNGSFMGCEKSVFGDIGINPGVGFGAEKGLSLINEILSYYDSLHFIKENGELNTSITIVDITNLLLKKHGWVPHEKIQKIEKINIYPSKYFCPMDYLTGDINITDQTYSIHHYVASWHSKEDKQIIMISRFFIKIFGRRNGRRISRLFDFPLRCKKKLKELGYKGTMGFCFQKMTIFFRKHFKSS